MVQSYDHIIPTLKLRYFMLPAKKCCALVSYWIMNETNAKKKNTEYLERKKNCVLNFLYHTVL